MSERKEVKTYTVKPEEIEQLLQAQFGDKLEPVDKLKLAKHKQRQFSNVTRAKKAAS
jgi:hypothetical protein